MKLFRKKEKLYGDLVKYSHKTALENVDMILREYEHKICKLDEKVQKLRKNKTKYSFKVNYRSTHGWTPQRKLNLMRNRDAQWPILSTSSYYEGHIRFDKQQIIEFVDVEPAALLQAVNENAEIDGKVLEVSEDIEILKKERDKFVKNYIPKRKRK